MKNNFSNKTIKIFTAKFIFLVLCVGFAFLTFWGEKKILVKGDLAKSYPVIVFDDYKKINLTSTTLDPERTLIENEIKTYPEDCITDELILDPVADGGAGYKITIKRAPVVYVEVDEGKKEIRNWNLKVSEIISKGGIILGPKDEINFGLNDIVTPGTTIVITRVMEAEIDDFEELDYETITKGDSSIPFGEKRIIQQGEKGQIKKTYKITYKNGKEVSRRLISREITKAKKDKVVAVGVIIGRANFGYYSGMVTSFYKGMKGRYLLVTNLTNGKQVKVKIIGSGPYNGPLMDMGTEPFQIIGGRLSDGYIPNVSVQLVD